MEINIYPKTQCIDIWIGSGACVPDISKIRQIFPAYSIAVLRSGIGNIESLTAELLQANL